MKVTHGHGDELILILLAYVLGAIGLALVLAFARERKPAPDGGTCGKCGYAVRGLTTFNCPECGSDLREVGITLTQRRGIISIIIVSVLVLMMLLLCAGLLMPASWQ